MDFEGKVVLITGASSGIGQHIAIHLSKLGAALALTGRNEKNLNETTANCTVNGPLKPLEIIGDITVDAERIIEETITYFGKLDVLINNAGLGIYGSIEEPSIMEQFDILMNINLRAQFHITHLAVPHLIETKGNIINMSSTSGLRAIPGLLVYSVSKGALDHFTKGTAMELARKGVRVNAINPGYIITPIHFHAGMDDDAASALLESEKERHALGRIGELEDVSNAVAFLASDKAAFITGILLAVDGGKHLMGPK